MMGAISRVGRLRAGTDPRSGGGGQFAFSFAQIRLGIFRETIIL